jgi:esterase/lipase
MERLFKDYRKYPKDVKERLKQAFEYIRSEYANLEDLEARITEAKKVINEIARKVFGANR